MKPLLKKLRNGIGLYSEQRVDHGITAATSDVWSVILLYQSRVAMLNQGQVTCLYHEILRILARLARLTFFSSVGFGLHIESGRNLVAVADTMHFSDTVMTRVPLLTSDQFL